MKTLMCNRWGAACGAALCILLALVLFPQGAGAVPTDNADRANGITVPGDAGAKKSGGSTNVAGASSTDDAAKADDAKADDEVKPEEKKEKNTACEANDEESRKAMSEQKADCQQQANENTERRRNGEKVKELSETCKQLLKCVELTTIDTGTGEGTDATQAAENTTATGTPEGYHEVIDEETGITRLVENRIGGCTDTECPQPAVQTASETGNGGAVVDYGNATPQDRELGTTDIKYGQTTAAVEQGLLPTGDTTTKAAFWLDYCRERGYPESVCATFVMDVKRESKFNPNAANGSSSAYGLGQYIDSTWESECSAYYGISRSSCMSSSVRGSAKAQAEVMMNTINQRYQKYQNGQLACGGLDFSACNYAVYHYAGGINSRYLQAGINYYNSTVNEVASLYQTAASALGDGSIDIAQLTLSRVPSNLTNAVNGLTGSATQLAGYTTTPTQSYLAQLMAMQGYGTTTGNAATLAAYNPYGTAYTGAVTSTTDTTGILGGQLPVILVSGDGDTSTDTSTPADCGGQVIDTVGASTGLVRKACIPDGASA